MKSQKNENEMYVTKRSGKREIISFDKILKRVKYIGKEFNLSNIAYAQLTVKVIDQIYDGIKTTLIDELTAEEAASMISQHPDYSMLASAISVSNLHKNTNDSFYLSMKVLYDFIDVNNNNYKLINENIMNFIEENKDFLDNIIDYKRDYSFDYFGFKTLERAYLIKCKNKIIERPQHMWLRVSICIHLGNLEKIKETYDLMSQKYFTHATPTLYNAGTPRPQLSSCYLISMEDDSIEGIFNTVKECALISKWSGGIGLHIHNVRSKDSHIRGTNGKSNGIAPMLGVFNKTAQYVDQGGKRNGSFAIYIEPHHPDIEDFLELRKNHGDEDSKARDLFYALWVSDLFMERVYGNKVWSLFCPDKCPGLSDVYGENFNKLYLKYENEKLYTKQINARDLWIKILDAQMETGTPYLLYKDSCNIKSNQNNIGTIKSSNLCTEIIEYSDSKETAVCNLASIGLPTFVNDDKTFDYDKLHDITKVITRNLNNIIDINFYPTQKTKISNYLHRPIGIGVQGLADVFFKMNIPFESQDAKEINKYIFETIYHAAIETSNEISIERCNDMKFIIEEYRVNNWWFATDDSYDKNKYQNNKYDMCNEYIIFNNTCASSSKVNKEDSKLEELLNKYKPIRSEIMHLSDNLSGSYSSFIGSHASKGELQFDLWSAKVDNTRYDWDKLKSSIIQYGIRNSLLCAPMPTASTSQILGNNECFEPITSNIYSRRTLAGEFIIVNKYLVNELLELGIWNDNMKQMIIKNKGSIKNISNIPDSIKDKYKTAWEIPMRHLIDMSRDRGIFICQSQSLNLWVEDPEPKGLTNMHFYAWRAGLKTGIYYLRRKPKYDAQQFTIEPEKISTNNNNNNNNNNNESDCLMCSG
jgi:ribonucleoside-diphosphate reductase alpha subunit